MKVLLERSGMAVLVLSDGTEIEGYGTLTVMERGGMKEGRGTFTSQSTNLFRAFGEAGLVTLAFADGLSGKVTVTQASPSGLTLMLSGPVTKP